MKKKTKCERYAQAITDYVLGEEIDVPKEELTAHLNECTQCRQELTNWQDFQDMLRVKEYHARPEVKEKWDRFISELTSPAPTRQDIIIGELNLDEKVGTPASILWQTLAKNGDVNILDLPKITKLEPPKAYSAFGWLAREKKVVLKKDAKGTYVCLTEPERQTYQQRQGRV